MKNLRSASDPTEPWNQPAGFQATATEESVETRRPAVVLWFRVYALLMSLMYLMVALAGLIGLFAPEDFSDGAEIDRAHAAVFAFMLLVLGLALSVTFLLALLPWRSRAGWIYHLVLICFGLTSLCCMPFSIFLLIFWIRNDCQAWYRRHQA